MTALDQAFIKAYSRSAQPRDESAPAPISSVAAELLSQQPVAPSATSSPHTAVSAPPAPHFQRRAAAPPAPSAPQIPLSHLPLNSSVDTMAEYDVATSTSPSYADTPDTAGPAAHDPIPPAPSESPAYATPLGDLTPGIGVVPPPPVAPTEQMHPPVVDPQSTSEADIVEPVVVAESPQLAAALQVDHIQWPSTVHQILSSAPGIESTLVPTLAALVDQGQNLFVVTSTRRGEGRTTTVAALARLLATPQRQVAIVDADFARPALAQSLQIAPQVGWEHALTGRVEFDEPLVESIADNVVLAPIVGPVAREAFIGTDQRLLDQFTALRQNFDVVLIDAPPVADGWHPFDRGMLALADAALWVCDARRDDATARCLAQYQAAELGLHMAGVIENFAQQAVSHYPHQQSDVRLSI